MSDTASGCKLSQLFEVFYVKCLQCVFPLSRAKVLMLISPSVLFALLEEPAMKSCTDIDRLQKMNTVDLHNPLTFPLAPS